jgi:hypothetical protein
VRHADVEGSGGDVKSVDGVVVEEGVEDVGQVVSAVVDDVRKIHLVFSHGF